VPEDFFIEMLRDIAPRFTPMTYNVLEHNCNNFTDECAELLIGHGIPKEIVDLPKTFLSTPMGKQFGPMIQQF
jgi:desumoylating isopeptidase 1